tara:strand:+ start:105 stop:281 length:177 start_codon:yes stop_codon:yes gene_type:complete
MGGAVKPVFKTPAQGKKLNTAMKSFKKDPVAFRKNTQTMLAKKRNVIKEEDEKKTLLG